MMVGENDLQRSEVVFILGLEGPCQLRAFENHVGVLRQMAEEPAPSLGGQQFDRPVRRNSMSIFVHGLNLC